MLHCRRRSQESPPPVLSSPVLVRFPSRLRSPLYSLTFGGTVSLTAFVSAVSLANEFSSRACSFR